MDVVRTSNIDLFVNRKTTVKGHSVNFDATTRSQDLPELICPSGATWISDVDRLKTYGTFYSEGYKFHKTSWLNAVDIDDLDDLQLAKAAKEKKQSKFWDQVVSAVKTYNKMKDEYNKAMEKLVTMEKHNNLPIRLLSPLCKWKKRKGDKTMPTLQKKLLDKLVELKCINVMHVMLQLVFQDTTIPLNY